MEEWRYRRQKGGAHHPQANHLGLQLLDQLLVLPEDDLNKSK